MKQSMGVANDIEKELAKEGLGVGAGDKGTSGKKTAKQKKAEASVDAVVSEAAATAAKEAEALKKAAEAKTKADEAEAKRIEKEKVAEAKRIADESKALVVAAKEKEIDRASEEHHSRALTSTERAKLDFYEEHLKEVKGIRDQAYFEIATTLRKVYDEDLFVFYEGDTRFKAFMNYAYEVHGIKFSDWQRADAALKDNEAYKGLIEQARPIPQPRGGSKTITLTKEQLPTDKKHTRVLREITKEPEKQLLVWQEAFTRNEAENAKREAAGEKPISIDAITGTILKEIAIEIGVILDPMAKQAKTRFVPYNQWTDFKYQEFRGLTYAIQIDNRVGEYNVHVDDELKTEKPLYSLEAAFEFVDNYAKKETPDEFSDEDVANAKPVEAGDGIGDLTGEPVSYDENGVAIPEAFVEINGQPVPELETVPEDRPENPF